MSNEVTTIGPECFTDGEVICYKGENYTRQPRTITTVDDLYALPSGSILLSHSEYPRYTGTVWRVSGLGMIERVGREVDGVTPLRYFKDPLPVTVLHKPEAQP